MPTIRYSVYDPDLGRWWRPDPIFQPWQSPYSAFDGNPIMFTDVWGLVSTDPNNYYGPPAPGTNGQIEHEDGIFEWDQKSQKWLRSSPPVVVQPSVVEIVGEQKSSIKNVVTSSPKDNNINMQPPPATLVPKTTTGRSDIPIITSNTIDYSDYNTLLNYTTITDINTITDAIGHNGQISGDLELGLAAGASFKLTNLLGLDGFMNIWSKSVFSGTETEGFGLNFTVGKLFLGVEYGGWRTKPKEIFSIFSKTKGTEYFEIALYKLGSGLEIFTGDISKIIIRQHITLIPYTSIIAERTIPISSSSSIGVQPKLILSPTLNYNFK